MLMYHLNFEVLWVKVLPLSSYMPFKLTDRNPQEKENQTKNRINATKFTVSFSCCEVWLKAACYMF